MRFNIKRWFLEKADNFFVKNVNFKVEQKKKNIFQKLLPSIVQSTAHSEMMRKQTKKMRKTAPSPGKKAKKEKYKDKMMRIYKLTPQQYDQAK